MQNGPVAIACFILAGLFGIPAFRAIVRGPGLTPSAISALVPVVILLVLGLSLVMSKPKPPKS
jgi:hypothetical protein